MADKVLSDLFDSMYTTTYARNLPESEFMGNVLFPYTQTNELSYKLLKGAEGLPVIANVHAFGTEADQGSREGAEVQTGKIPGIKRKIPLDEEFLVKLNRAGMGDLESVRNEIFGDLKNMVDGVKARIEKMRMDAIAMGEISIDDGKIIANVDFQVPSEHQETLSGTSAWNDTANSNPLQWIQDATETVESNTGVRPERAITSRRVVSYILQNENVRAQILGNNYTNSIITQNQVNELLARMGLPQIATYDKKYRLQAENGTYSTGRYWPEDRFTLIPGGTLGQQLMGPTPEALLDENIQATDVPGLYARTYKYSNDPVGIMTLASATSMPTFARADEIFIGVVLDEA